MTSPADRLRLGILGAGNMGRRVADAADRSGRFVITAVTDAVPQRAVELADRFGAEAVPSAERLIDRSLVDAGYLGAPNGVRVAVCELAASAGTHLLIDKPLCGSPEEADQILDAHRRTTAVWMMGFSYRFRREWQRAHEVIASGVLGRPLFVTDVIVEAAADTPEWYWQPGQGGGVIQLQAHHCLDRIGWLLNSQVSEIAGLTGDDDGHLERAAHLSVRYADGAAAGISLGFGTSYEGPARTLFVVQCADGMIAIDDDRGISISDSAGTVLERGDNDWLAGEVECFADAVAGTCRDYPTVTDGADAAAAAAAAARSAARGEWVRPIHRSRRGSGGLNGR